MIFSFITKSLLMMLMIMIIMTLTASVVYADDDPEDLGKDNYNFSTSCYSIQHCQNKNGTSFFSNQCGNQSNKYGCGLFVECLPASKSSSKSKSKSKSKSSKSKCPSGSTKENCISACQSNGCCLKSLIPFKKKPKHNSKKKKHGN